MIRLSLSVTITEPVWRSPWISASAEVRNLYLSRETASLRATSARNSAAMASSCGRGPAVQLGDAIGIGEDQILGDLAELGIAGEDRRQRLLLARRQSEVAGHEQALGQIFHDMPGEGGVAAALDHAVAHDYMRLQQLHDHGVEWRLVMIDLGNQPADMGPLDPHIFMLEEGALQCHRPALADEADIGQRLLDADPARGAFHQEDEVEIAVAHLGDLPVRRAAAEPGRDIGQPREPGGQRILRSAAGSPAAFPASWRSSPLWPRE